LPYDDNISNSALQYLGKDEITGDSCCVDAIDILADQKIDLVSRLAIKPRYLPHYLGHY
jgi:hypothetical protein